MCSDGLTLIHAITERWKYSGDRTWRKKVTSLCVPLMGILKLWSLPISVSSWLNEENSILFSLPPNMLCRDATSSKTRKPSEFELELSTAVKSGNVACYIMLDRKQMATRSIFNF